MSQQEQASSNQPVTPSYLFPPCPTTSHFGGTTPNSYPYDAQTLAYYNAYYNQVAAAQAVAGQYAVSPVTTLNVPVNSSSSSSQAVPPVADDSKKSQASDDDDDPTVDRSQKTTNIKNILPVHGNEKTMNLNPMLLKNIQQSLYFKTTLYGLKTVNEVIDEIWSNVRHMEPWERGSRNTSGQTGMCGSVRGVGAGGIVSTVFCLLYKLFTLRPTRKQVMSFIKCKDSPYIRATGFLYLRFTQPPDSLWQWFERFLSDPEEFQPKAGGGGPPMTIGEMVRHLLTKLEWFSTHFPRIPIPILKDIEKKLAEYDQSHEPETPERLPQKDVKDQTDRDRRDQVRNRDNEEKFCNPRDRSRSRSRDKDRKSRHSRDGSRERSKRDHRSRSRSRERYRHRSPGGHDRDRSHHYRDRERDRHRRH